MKIEVTRNSICRVKAFKVMNNLDAGLGIPLKSDPARAWDNTALHGYRVEWIPSDIFIG